MARSPLYQGVSIEDLRWMHKEIAELALEYPEALHIFERLDNDLKAAEAMIAGDPITAARAMLANQSAIR
ncbi:hypothetical protein [Paracoccus sp. (in: a-proteobacteria)]|uniref:hypothetical protein n=1 Tax=Paracoccus sp. TaxID=267 RepID=UPI0028B02A43|nr:hypothetical protein [Paracoccus sp. (in: a-proteobacteria)]